MTNQPKITYEIEVAGRTFTLEAHCNYPWSRQQPYLKITNPPPGVSGDLGPSTVTEFTRYLQKVADEYQTFTVRLDLPAKSGTHTLATIMTLQEKREIQRQLKRAVRSHMDLRFHMGNITWLREHDRR